jgi:hypothetical protein
VLLQPFDAEQLAADGIAFIPKGNGLRRRKYTLQEGVQSTGLSGLHEEGETDVPRPSGASRSAQQVRRDEAPDSAATHDRTSIWRHA